MRRGNALAAWLPVCLVAAVLAVPVPTSAAPTRECFLLTQCTPVVGPWVVIPATAARQVPVPAGVTVGCPDGDSEQLAVGSDYELSGGSGGPPPDVSRLMSGPGAGLITGGDALFFAVTFVDIPASFRPHVGCIPEPQDAQRGAAVEQGRSRVVRTREVRLRPSRAITSSHRCRRGERLTRGLAGVLFHRRRPPTARELRDVTVTHRRLGRRVRASVRTGPRVGDRERVTLQILAVCAR